MYVCMYVCTLASVHSHDNNGIFHQHWENCIEERTGPPPEPCTDNITYVQELGECECVKNTTINTMAPYNCTPVYKSSVELFF